MTTNNKELEIAAKAALRYLEKRRNIFTTGSVDAIAFDAVVEALRTALEKTVK